MIGIKTIINLYTHTHTHNTLNHFKCNYQLYFWLNFPKVPKVPKVRVIGLAERS